MAEARDLESINRTLEGPMYIERRRVDPQVYGRRPDASQRGYHRASRDVSDRLRSHRRSGRSGHTRDNNQSGRHFAAAEGGYNDDDSNSERRPKTTKRSSDVLRRHNPGTNYLRDNDDDHESRKRRAVRRYRPEIWDEDDCEKIEDHSCSHRYENQDSDIKRRGRTDTGCPSMFPRENSIREGTVLREDASGVHVDIGCSDSLRAVISFDDIGDARDYWRGREVKVRVKAVNHRRGVINLAPLNPELSSSSSSQSSSYPSSERRGRRGGDAARGGRMGDVSIPRKNRMHRDNVRRNSADSNRLSARMTPSIHSKTEDFLTETREGEREQQQQQQQQQQQHHHHHHHQSKDSEFKNRKKSSKGVKVENQLTESSHAADDGSVSSSSWEEVDEDDDALVYNLDKIFSNASEFPDVHTLANQDGALDGKAEEEKEGGGKKQLALMEPLPARGFLCELDGVYARQDVKGFEVPSNKTVDLKDLIVQQRSSSRRAIKNLNRVKIHKEKDKQQLLSKIGILCPVKH
eukprot:jgi/Bigna1/146213/aug1.110_g20921